MDSCHYFAICKIMILRPNLVVCKISSSKPVMIPRPQLQEEEQQEQVSSAGSFARSFLLSFFCFPCQKQLGPEPSLHLRDLTAVSQIIQRSVKPIRLSNPQSDWDIFLLFLRIITLSGDWQLTTYFFQKLFSPSLQSACSFF